MKVILRGSLHVARALMASVLFWASSDKTRDSNLDRFASRTSGKQKRFGAAGHLAALGLVVTLAQAFSVAQASGQEESVAAVVDSSESLQELRSIESMVQKVVRDNMDACVSLSDGMGAGSGVIVSEDGLILTAAHVLVSQGEYNVLFPDGRTAKARSLGSNLNVDAGMAQLIDPGPWPFVEIGTSESLKQGDWVVSLGHSGGFELGRKPPVRTGRVLGRNEFQLETDAVLIGGDSGGPLFDLGGKLVGIHSSIGDSVAENRHVMMEIFGTHFERMKRGEIWGRLPALAKGNEGNKPPKMGVVIDKVTATVNSVRPQSPAADSGIKEGDIVLRFDGVKLNSGNHLIDLVKKKISGDVVRVQIDRDGRLFEFEVRLK